MSEPAYVPTDSRGGRIVVASASATEAELRNVERALMHPPKSIDWARSILSVLTAAGLVLKAYVDLIACIQEPAKHPSPFWSVALIVLAAVMVVFVAQELIQKLTEKHPFHDAALSDIRKLIEEQSATQPPQSGETAPPASRE